MVKNNCEIAGIIQNFIKTLGISKKEFVELLNKMEAEEKLKHKCK